MNATRRLKALARSAAVLAAMCCDLPMALADGEFGRLFFTPEERQSLDRERQHPGESRARASSTVVINGVVARSSGRHTIWVNGAAQHDRETASGLVAATRLDDPASISIAPVVPGPTGGAGGANVRVGGTIDLETAQTTDLVAGGRIRTRERPGKSLPP